MKVQTIPQPLPDEPAAKKAKTEESLVPESEFLAQHPVRIIIISKKKIIFICKQSPVTFKVIVPHMPEKSEWRLNGQIVSLTLPLNDSVSTKKVNSIPI